jgi:hypothetical protein
LQARFFALAALMLTALGCSEQQAPEHVPGVPVTYPVDARSYLRNLGMGMGINCESEDKAVEASCLTRVENRVRACLDDMLLPSALEDKDHAARVSRRFLQCSMPHIICKGIEVKSPEDEQRFCRSST